MIEKINRNDWSLFRMIIPASREVNIFTRQAKKTTALGPVLIATVADKLWGWRGEVIDENNYRGPRDSQALPNHAVLQRENPATVVGFYCGLTCTMPRVWEIANFYQQQKVGTIAGGRHAYYCPEETLQHNIDVVVPGDGEMIIQQLLNVLEKGGSLENVHGISFMEKGQVKSNPPEALENPNLNDLPFPDFGLLKYASIKIYPIGRIRGCSMNCEFCSVKGKPRWACAKHLFNTVRWLVETRRARHFFIVDDNLWQDPKGTMDFFRMVAEKYGNRLHFSVQIRLDTTEKLLKLMKKAGVRHACIGLESPIDNDLKAMGKGYSSSNMLERVKILRRYFWIHGMFIVGYPLKERQKPISPKEILKCFRRFIRKAAPDTVQILLPVPIVGSDLRERLEKEGRLFSLELVPLNRYDGNYPCFEPDNMSVREYQRVAIKIMSRFYNFWSFFRIPLRTISFPIDYFIIGRKHYWCREVTKYKAHRLIQTWRKKQKKDKFIEELEKHINQGAGG